MILFLLAILIAIPIALLRSGSFAKLGSINIKGWWLLILLLLGQLLLTIYATPNEYELAQRAAFLLFTYGLALAILALNIRQAGMQWMAIGLLLNLTVMAANGGWMPITLEAARAVKGESYQAQVNEKPFGAKNRILDMGQTKLGLLSDIIVIPNSFVFPAALSLGDLCIDFGAAVLIYKTMVNKDED